MVEVDFLPASQSQSGDCILMRIGSFSYDFPRNNNQNIVMIDSGFSECAEKIKNHLIQYYKTQTIDFVFITHPDADHISGLNALLDDPDINIQNIYVHDPWNYVNSVFFRTKDGRRTRRSISGNFEDTLKILDQVFDKIEKRKIHTQEAFEGNFLEIGNCTLQILGPSREYYKKLLLQFPGMEKERGAGVSSVYEEFTTDWRLIDKYFMDNPQTSAKNDSSMIILLNHTKTVMNGLATTQEPLFLFTGDAGVPSLYRAMYYAKNANIPINGCQYMQLPHHGSIKNINGELLKYIDAEKFIVSASATDDEHPSRLLVNYVRNVLDKTLYHVADDGCVRLGFDGAPSRPGWGCAPIKSSFSRVFGLSEDV